ncbi:MAG: ABC transporter ATP-binding protein [Bacillota bacterium]|nr:ABC transporter ATP-binding protein [Bacillota bacterium]
MHVFRRILPYLKPYRKQLAVGLGALVLANPLTLFHPLVWMFITDEVVLNGQVHLLLPALGVMVGVHLLGTALSALHRNMLEKVGQRFVVDLRLAVYEKLQRQSVSFYHNNRTGDLLSRAMNDIDAMQQAIIQGIDQVLSAFLRFTVVVAAILSIQPVVGAATLLPLTVVFFLVRIFNDRVKALYRRVRDRLGDVTALLQENLAGQLVIKAFAREPEAMERFRASNQQYLAEQDRAVNARTIFLPGAQFVGFLSSVVMVGLGAWFVVRGMFTIGGLVAYRGYWWQLYSPIDTLATVNELLQRAVAAGSRVFELLDTEEAIKDPPGAVELKDVRGEIEFDNVTFAYGDDVVLRNVSLKIPAGSTVAFVGASGAGKTTLLHLVPRFFDPQEGVVRIDGRDVRTVQQRSLRRHMAMVLQETILFSGTVADNIRFAKPHATDEEVIQAARMANAHEFIEKLPQGYDTPVGERGVKLSGGQRQRIAIARAFLADPRILILDEATSAVEPESEWIIQQTLERLMRGRTTLITSHRLSMVRQADLIVALDRGRIVEMGTHDELMAKRGLYYEMYTLQVGHLRGKVDEQLAQKIS